MEINLKVKSNLQIRAFYLFFIISGIQVTVGILNAPRDVFLIAGRDAWFAILIAFIYMLITVTVMLYILKQYNNADIFGIQIDIFGQWFGKVLGTIYILYFFGELLSVLQTYMLVIQIFIYPEFPTFILAILLMSLVVYAVLGGIRVIVGVIFIFGLLIPWIFLLLYDPVSRMEMSHFLPMFQSSVTELFQGAQTITYTFLGIEFLFIIYPFIQDKKKVKLPVYLGLTVTLCLVLFVTVISIGYFSLQDFERMDWPVLRLFKSVSFSFLERFDYIVVTEWMMVTLPTMILLMWAMTHGTKRLYRVAQKKTLYTATVLLIVISSSIKYSYHIQHINKFISLIGFWIVFVYPFVLLPFVLIKKKRRQHKGRVRS